MHPAHPDLHPVEAGKAVHFQAEPGNEIEILPWRMPQGGRSKPVKGGQPWYESPTITFFKPTLV
jgi:hypothetical protein